MDPRADNLPAHSPLGASGAYRWMVCPGSVPLSHGIEDEESEHAALGTAAHALAQHCLTNKVEPWEVIGAACTQYGIVGVGEADPGDLIIVDKGMADAVQEFIDCLNVWHPDRHQGNSWVERHFHCPTIHKYFFGTSDFVALDEDRSILDVWDYKHGVGIVVEAEDNPQLMYYAAGVLEDLNMWEEVDEVRVHIFQPRGWHWQGPHRHVTIGVLDLLAWLEDVCVPAMDHALVSRETKTGDHCRFCPARKAQCPALMQDLAEYEELLMQADGEDKVALMTPEQLGRLLQLNEIAKIAIKAASKSAHGLLASGHAVPGVKLVKARTNREFKKGAEAAAKKKFGKEALTKPELKSPAQMDQMPGGKEFTARWAFKPEGGTTVAPDGDPRKPIKRDVKSLFKPVKKGEATNG